MQSQKFQKFSQKFKQDFEEKLKFKIWQRAAEAFIPRLSEFEILNDATLIILNFPRFHNNDFCRNHILIMNLNGDGRVDKFGIIDIFSKLTIIDKALMAGRVLGKKFFIILSDSFIRM